MIIREQSRRFSLVGFNTTQEPDLDKHILFTVNKGVCQKKGNFTLIAVQGEVLLNPVRNREGFSYELSPLCDALVWEVLPLDENLEPKRSGFSSLKKADKELFVVQEAWNWHIPQGLL